MSRKYIVPLLAFLGALFGIWTVYMTQKTVPTPPILFPPAVPPYKTFIAGVGVLEASSQNIAIGTPFNEIIKEIFVTEGAFVKKGDPLFQLDLRSFESALKSAEASLQLALIEEQNQKIQFSFYEKLKNKDAVSEQIYQQNYYAMHQAEANVKVAKANVNIAKINLERATARAPIDGEILQVNIHVGEIAYPASPLMNVGSNTSQNILILMGSSNPMQIRIDIDQDDAWRFQAGAKATAFVRGNRAIKIPLKFTLIEPCIIPKSSFTGITTERVDTRVLQVLYRFDKGDFPIYIGQILDVYIESTIQGNPYKS